MRLIKRCRHLTTTKNGLSSLKTMVLQLITSEARIGQSESKFHPSLTDTLISREQKLEGGGLNLINNL